MLAKVVQISVTKGEHWEEKAAIVAAFINRSEVVRYLQNLAILHFKSGLMGLPLE
jgi:hypothetical protein